jgi:hypothetical protein
MLPAFVPEGRRTQRSIYTDGEVAAFVPCNTCHDLLVRSLPYTIASRLPGGTLKRNIDFLTNRSQHGDRNELHLL